MRTHGNENPAKALDICMAAIKRYDEISRIGQIPHGDIHRSMRLFAKEFMPAFR